MKTMKRLSLLLAFAGIIVIASCGGPNGTTTTTINGTTTTTPYDSIGTVINAIPSTNADTTSIAGVSVTTASNSFGVVIDVSDSLNKLSDWTDHKPFLVGSFAGFDANGTNMENWGVATNNTANMMTAATETDLYYIVITLGEDIMTNSELGTNDGTYTITYKYGNMLNTEAGLSNVQSDFWANAGMASIGSDNFSLVLKNTGGTITVISNLMPDLTTPAGSYISADGKVTGFKVNGSVSDWSVQTSGLAEIASGTIIRIVWDNVPTTSLPTNGALWADWPVNAVVTGGSAWLHTNNTSTWDPAIGQPVTVSTTLGKAVVNITLTDAIAPGVEFKLANSTGWNNGEELNNHAATLAPADSTGYITIEVEGDFATTNL